MSAARAPSLLIELGTEELPPKALDELASAFANGVCEGLTRRGVAADVASAKPYCSPRRLAAWIPDVATAQPDQQQERRGPAVNAGLDANGEPTKALLGFAQSCGVEVAQLEKLETDKGAWFVHRATKPGQPTAALIPEIVAEALKALPIPKPMRWGDHDYAFVRPAHWLVMLHGHDVIEGEILGQTSGRMSRGHRFHHPQLVHIVDADSWLDALHAAKVIADPVARRARVRAEVARVAPAGVTPQLPEALEAEIANLTEWPVAIPCAFDREFLAVPQEALVTTMETNQKFVPMFDAQGKLTEHFIGVANIESKDPAEIRKGYERVIRPRFADAKFFWDEDLKTPLAANQEALKDVTYQQALGSVWDKSVRAAELARVIANRVGVDASLATRAAALSKCDLLTRMVGEFPELQGVMGRYYATANGEHPEVAQALDAFYAPRFAGDAIAQGKVAQVLSVAERLDTLAGIFAVGQKPSGNKDPFALRRTALGLARTLIEARLPLDLNAQLAEAFALLPDSALSAGLPKGKDGKATPLDAGARRAELVGELYDFILDRLRGYYTEQRISGEAFEAVRVLAPDDLTDFDRRLRAVVEFAALPEAQALAAANKRIGNILRQAGDVKTTTIDEARLEGGAERDLATALRAAQADGAPLIAARDYVGLLKRLARLREPVDRYFDAVMVMVDDTVVRTNRLALLAQLRSLFLRVADIALLPTV
ncbi:glycine--tRNA ligase subunit beta [Dokdonella soli]|uniref:Glycine--tRNA ligase beta subunit n=1 Tax=Dokdonella soli TaxID=529810 RepID=A0ABN1IH46_9GAMM